MCTAHGQRARVAAACVKNQRKEKFKILTFSAHVLRCNRCALKNCDPSRATTTVFSSYSDEFSYLFVSFPRLGTTFAYFALLCIWLWRLALIVISPTSNCSNKIIVVCIWRQLNDRNLLLLTTQKIICDCKKRKNVQRVQSRWDKMERIQSQNCPLCSSVTIKTHWIQDNLKSDIWATEKINW